MAGLDAFGTQLERANDIGTYAAIANITNFKGPNMKRNTDDVTAHDSPNRYSEFIGLLVDPGEIACDVNYDPANHDSLVADFEDTTPRGYKLTYPLSSSEWAFTALLTGFDAQAPVDGKLAATVTFKVSGKPVITTPAP